MTKNEHVELDPLGILINRELSSIEFVRDYYQFRFDGPTLTVFTNPELRVNEISYKRESDKFCNLLINCIGQQIISATVQENDSIQIGFENGYQLFISLKSTDFGNAEAAIFDDKLHGWWAW